MFLVRFRGYFLTKQLMNRSIFFVAHLPWCSRSLNCHWATDKQDFRLQILQIISTHLCRSRCTNRPFIDRENRFWISFHTNTSHHLNVSLDKPISAFTIPAHPSDFCYKRRYLIPPRRYIDRLLSTFKARRLSNAELCQMLDCWRQFQRSAFLLFHFCWERLGPVESAVTLSYRHHYPLSFLQCLASSASCSLLSGRLRGFV